MGASLGCMILQHAALQRPDLVAACIFMVGVGGVSGYTVVMIEAMRELFAAGAQPPPAVFAA